MKRRSKRTSLIVAAGALLAVAAFSDTAHAQFYKDKTITMIVNYPAGGPTDIEGRIVALHLPDHIPGKPNVVVKNVGGAGGIIGSNQLGEASPNGETIGFFTADLLAQLIGNPSVRTKYEEFVMIVGVQNPLVFYARKDTPPGLKAASDIMNAHDFKALSLSLQSSNTVNQALCLDLLGIKYQAIPAYRGLKDVETAILQDIGQMANTSLPGWYGSVLPTMEKVVLPLWQIAPRAKDGSYPRSVALPDLPTFEEFYASVNGGKKPSGIQYETLRTVSDPLVAMFRVAVLPPKASGEAVTVLRAAFADLWKDKGFIDDYAKVIKTPPIMVSGDEAEDIMAEVARVKPETKAFLVDFTNHLVK
jgi:tripartite-type tricarboxylate transporter receptor subunit TctC